MKQTKENKQILKDVGLLMKVEKWSLAQAKSKSIYGKKADLMKLSIESGKLLNIAVKIIIPTDPQSKKPYNIVKALKEMKQFVHLKGYDR
jgi:hypothetical protein